ncbi:uncharacterized protein LOC130985650 isoform X2 [Salvia miltiorrhiza]|uniref:uncharacterized protein LOC130985650 isoform X2 n=1 Tax=Salvia miltiorrhiza TaxID=226208 RepID=UPI0025ACFC6D|nr:uncharacterized protein LOC130985650 isoform X2 [Salvia miltiorrhiza]
MGLAEKKCHAIDTAHHLSFSHDFLTTLSRAAAAVMAMLHRIIISVSVIVLCWTTASGSIHELLRSRGLPAGLFPKNGVKSYELSEDGLLQVFLESPCVAKLETRISFESVVRANLSYGGLMGVEGLSQEELFLWLPVKDIIVYDPSSGLILFDIGLAHKQMSLSLFEDPPLCYPRFGLMDRRSGFRVQR